MLGHKIVWNQYMLEKIGVTTEEILKIPQKLMEYFNYYRSCFSRMSQMVLGLIYITGLLSKLERKSVEPIALDATGNANTVRYLQLFITNSPWDTEKAGKLYRERTAQRISEEDGMLTFDESDFLKKGKKSAGVARQYCGIVGATNNCQAGIFMGYAGSKGYGLLEAKLYVPEKWFDEEHEELRKKCKFPDEVEYKDKCKMCIELLKKAIKEENFKVKWVSFDSTFGVDHKLRHEVSSMNLYYFASLRSTICIWPQMPIMRTSKRKGVSNSRPITKPISVMDFINNDNDNPWIESIIAEGSKGPIRTHIKLFRVYENIDGLPGDEVWLFVRRYADGDLKFAFCNAPEDTPCEVLDEKSLSRWSIEQCFEECKTELGMSNYEVRSYNGWQRHMLFVMMAHEFLCEVQNMFKEAPIDNSQYIEFNYSETVETYTEDIVEITSDLADDKEMPIVIDISQSAESSCNKTVEKSDDKKIVELKTDMLIYTDNSTYETLTCVDENFFKNSHFDNQKFDNFNSSFENTASGEQKKRKK